MLSSADTLFRNFLHLSERNAKYKIRQSFSRDTSQFTDIFHADVERGSCTKFYPTLRKKSVKVYRFQTLQAHSGFLASGKFDLLRVHSFRILKKMDHLINTEKKGSKRCSFRKKYPTLHPSNFLSTSGVLVIKRVHLRV